MPRPLITARWANLVLISYAVPPGLLWEYTPAGPGGEVLEPDVREDFVREGEAQAIMTLVALEFRDTRIVGGAWPGLRAFPLLGLRFYARHAGRRGVVYIRQIVPNRFLAWGARKVHGEPFVAAPLTSEVRQHQRTIGVEYRLRFPREGLGLGGSAIGRAARGLEMEEHLVRVIGGKPVTRAAHDSLEHWIKEHQYGFGLDPRGHPGVFEVIHPTWGVYPVMERVVRLNFASVFGPDWGFLGAMDPVSVILAVGSEVSVFLKQRTAPVRWGERGRLGA